MNEQAQDAALPATADMTGRAGSRCLQLGDCRIEVDLDRVVATHGETALEPKAMAVLVHLAEHAGQVVSASELIDAVWHGRPMGDNPVYRCIAQLRRALGDDPRAPRYIATVPTKGYRLVVPVVPVDASSDAGAEGCIALSPAHEPKPEGEIRTHPPRRLRWLAAVVALGALAGGAWLFWPRPAIPPSPSPAPGRTLVVLPLHTATADASGQLLGSSLTEMVRARLARMPGLTVIAEGSTRAASVGDATPQGMAARLHADYLLAGEVVSTKAGLLVATRLIDARSGGALWSVNLERPDTGIGAIRDALVQRVAGTLNLAPPATAAGEIPLDAYRSYTIAQRYVRQADPTGAGRALELFRRATILDPGFARAYLGLGRALQRVADADPGPAAAMRDEAARAFARAIEIDPSLGEAWSEQARLAATPAQAEALYRKGLGLAPSDGDGYVHYARFLFAHARVGEAIAAMEHARRIEPLAPELCLTQAFFVMVVRSDVAEHDRLVEQALAIDPRLPEALYQLAYSKWEYSGRFAEAAVLIDRAIAAQPGSTQARALARDIYLDLGEPGAAAAALGASPPPVSLTELAQYRGDNAAAASALTALAPAAWPDRGPQAAKAQAVRDAAIDHGDPGDAVHTLQAVHAAHVGSVPMWYRGFDLVYAHAMVLAGQRQQGQTLAQGTLAMVDAHGLGRTPHWFSRERAAAFMVLGDHERALRELEHSVANGQVYRWWYLADRDPLFAPLRNDPRFQELDRKVRLHREKQRALLQAMRREQSPAH